MRKQIKWMLSLLVVIAAVNTNAQTTIQQKKNDSKIGFKLKPSIEKRMKRTERKKRHGNLPAEHKTPTVSRRSKSK
jgi:hypothetical protein